MSVIRREDDSVFVLQPYRESLGLRGSSLLKKEIRHLANMHGDNVRLFHYADRLSQYEAVFSRESGYLLGESIWQYFKKPQELIYCEVLGNTQQALLVIVRDGQIYLDNKIAIDDLAKELTALTSEEVRYVVYVCGQVSLGLAENKIASFTQLDESVFAQLPLSDAAKLLPLERALDEFRLGKKQESSRLILVAAIILAGLSFWVYYQSKAPEQPKRVALNPFTQYQNTLQTPAPAQQINALTNELMQFYSMQGWYPSRVTYDGNTAKVVVRSLGGTATNLLNWAQENGMQVNFSPQGASVDFATTMSPRPKASRILNTQQSVAVIIDRMMQLLPGKAVTIGDSVQAQALTQTNLTITFRNIAPDVLQLVGSNLNDLPVNLTGCQLTIKNGMLSGSIQLTVVGS